MLYGYKQLHCSCENRWYLQDIAEDVEKRFNTSNYEIDRPLPKGKNKKVVALMKDKLRGKSWRNLLDWEQKNIAI